MTKFNDLFQSAKLDILSDPDKIANHQQFAPLMRKHGFKIDGYDKDIDLYRKGNHTIYIGPNAVWNHSTAVFGRGQDGWGVQMLGKRLNHFYSPKIDDND